MMVRIMLLILKNDKNKGQDLVVMEYMMMMMT